jgi:hypothetical protein
MSDLNVVGWLLFVSRLDQYFGHYLVRSVKNHQLLLNYMLYSTVDCEIRSVCNKCLFGVIYGENFSLFFVISPSHINYSTSHLLTFSSSLMIFKAC